MKKIDATSITDQIYRHLLEAMVGGEIVPGEKLVEENISAELGVSRTPVREALNRLTSDGFVMFRPRSGRFAKKFSKKDIDDIFELRCLLEKEALRLAASRISARECDELLAMIKKCAKPGGRYEGQMLETDALIHDLFCSRCGNRYLEESLRRLMNLSLPFRKLTARKPGMAAKLNLQRAAIVGALRDGDVGLACKCLEEHIRAGKESCLGFASRGSGAQTARKGLQS